MKYAYYPGCSLEKNSAAYDVSVRAVADLLGIKLMEIDDWNCCGATEYFSQDELVACSVIARNLALAESLRGFFDIPDLPLSERFFAGGGSSLRGFETDRAGPLFPGTDKPQGGNALVVGNVEIRFPLWRAIQLAGFYDTGNVFSRISDIRPSGFSHSVGGGIRIKTPFGPLRADYGINLNLPSELQRQGLSPRNLFITIGPPF